MSVPSSVALITEWPEPHFPALWAESHYQRFSIFRYFNISLSLSLSLTVVYSNTVKPSQGFCTVNALWRDVKDILRNECICIHPFFYSPWIKLSNGVKCTQEWSHNIFHLSCVAQLFAAVGSLCWKECVIKHGGLIVCGERQREAT